MANYFPLFTDLENMPILIFGGEKKAFEKIEKLREYSPLITVAAPTVITKIPALADVQVKICSYDDAELLLCRIRPQFVIIADVPPDAIPYLFALCRKYNLPVNTVDRKEYCTFIFPSTIQKKHLTVAISTSGASPAAAKLLREEIEKNIPSDIESILDWFAETRKTLRARRDLDQTQSAAYHRALAAFSFHENRPPSDEETEKILQNYKIN